MRKYKIAVFTGNRESVKEFFSHFKKIEVKFIKLDYYPIFGFDPASLIVGNRGNLSWQFVRGLEDQLKGCDAVYISDTYYFTCYQIVRCAKKFNIPVFTEIWTTIPNHISSWLFPYGYITKFVVENTKLFILRSKTAYKFTNSLGIKKNKTVMIYKGVNLNLFKN